MNPALQSVLESNWLSNPVTKDVIATLAADEKELLDKCIANSDVPAITDTQIRCWLIRAKALRQAKSVIETVNTTKNKTK